MALAKWRTELNVFPLDEAMCYRRIDLIMQISRSERARTGPSGLPPVKHLESETWRGGVALESQVQFGSIGEERVCDSRACRHIAG